MIRQFQKATNKVNADTADRDENLQLSKRIDLRRKGIFLVLGGLVFLFQGLFYLNDTITWLLLLALELIYVFVFPEKESKKQQASLIKFFRFLVQLVLLLIVVFIISLVWVWLWRITGIPFSFLAAITVAFVGFVLIGWSYAAIPNR